MLVQELNVGISLLTEGIVNLLPSGRITGS